MDPSMISQIPDTAWTSSLTGLPRAEHAHLDSFFGGLGGDGIPGGFKARDEGSRLWLDEYVRTVRVCALDGERWIVSARVRPSMRSTKPYTTQFAMSKADGIDSGLCSCAAGASGLCKHVAAVWYTLWGYQRKGLADVPPDKAPTEVRTTQSNVHAHYK